jgi:GntR family transcriptional repressor for pyruvate dehydrogenase complex
MSQATQEKRGSTTERLFDQLLVRIRQGTWPVGSAIPSERTLMVEFGVSRIAIREALSMLRSLGVLDVSHGRRAIVRQVDAETLGRLFPLMLSLEGEQTFQQVFEIRVAIEAPAAYLAALRHTEDDVRRLEELVEQFNRRFDQNFDARDNAELELHLGIARATKNPLFATLLSAIAGYVIYVQSECCRDDVEMRQRAKLSHESIVDAIRHRDPQRARVEMEAHLRFNADRATKKGLVTIQSPTITEGQP